MESCSTTDCSPPPLYSMCDKVGLARSASRDYTDRQEDRLTCFPVLCNGGTRVVDEFYVLVSLWPLIVCFDVFG